MKHHTKDKGDIGVGAVISDLMKNGIKVAIPLSEHLPFDLVGIYPDNTIKKISVKYRQVTKFGTIDIKFSSSHADKKGNHTKDLDKSSVDLFAVYCPETNECYYFNHNNCNTSIKLRINNSRNKQKLGVHLAKDYTNPLIIK